MKISILDDVHDTVAGLQCFGWLAGHDVAIWRDHTKDIGELAHRLRDTEALALIRERTPVTEALVRRLPRLKLISMRGPYPHVDVAACARHGVLVSARQQLEHPSYATAELTWALILMAMRDLPAQMASLRAGGWQKGVGIGLRGRILGIYGYGRIGSLVAGYGKAFGMQVLVLGHGAAVARAEAEGYAVAASREAFLERCDVISLHLPLRRDTRAIVTAADLARMRPDSVLVNASRAELIAPGALVRALQAGRPGKAAVDVFEEEPMTDPAHPLLQMDNVIATPHVGYVERDAYESQFGDIFDQILAYAGGRPIHLVERPWS